MQTGRVAVFLPSLAGGGAERIMLHLIGEFSRRGLGVDLVLNRLEGPYQDLIPEGVQVVSFGAYTQRACVMPLMRYLRQQQPAAIISALDENSLITLFAKAVTGVKTRVIVGVHNTTSVHWGRISTRRSQAVQFGIKRLFPRADSLVAVSSGVADDMAQMISVPRDRVGVIYNPVVSEELLAQAKEPVQHPWFAPGELPVLLSVGRLSPQKDFGLLLCAFARVQRQIPARLMILGEGPERSALEKLTHDLGLDDCVAFPGFASNPYAYMSRSAVFVLSSQWEGLPTVLIEAMACGTPVVATDCPSGPREILAGGRYGSLVPVGDEDRLAEALLQALREPKRPPVESWQPYRIEAVADEYMKVISD